MQNGFDDFDTQVTAEEFFTAEERAEILADLLRLEAEELAEQEELDYLAALDRDPWEIN